MEALRTGVELSIVGMGLVFLVLGLLWGLVALLARLDAASGPAPRAAELPAAAAGTLDPETLAAVGVAIRMHLRALRRQAAPAARVHPPGSLPSRWVSTGRTRQNRSFTPRGRYV
jgi:Na+-transporting methylmalonyl-CoA/oxaloacetate decarboxylase gamma subunit